MEEELISLVTARLAKKKGFNLEVFNQWGVTHGPLVEKWEIGHNFNRHLADFNGDDYSDFCCSAPTQSILQKWLREKHNIIVLVHKPLGYMCTVNGEPLGEKALASYEDVLEQGLKKGLKKVKLKNK